MQIEILIIDDDKRFEQDAKFWALKDKYGDNVVNFIDNAQGGIDYIQENLHKNIIVVLDFEFSVNEKNGRQVFNEIMNFSSLIPVLFLTGSNRIEKDDYADIINNHAFGIYNKMITPKEFIEKIEKAVLYFDTSLDNTIEDWIIANKNDKDKPIYLTSSGQSYSLNEILKEIRMQTPIGKDFSKKFNALTIDLLLRNKEKLND